MTIWQKNVKMKYKKINNVNNNNINQILKGKF